MKYKVLLFFLVFISLNASAYNAKDSMRVVRILNETKKVKGKTQKVLFVARQFLGTPYVGQTLEINDVERLVVNTRELDCTTYVENVAALSLCANRGETTFAAYLRQLQKLRYRSGNIGYPERLHYFTSWIDDNTQMGFVKNIFWKGYPFTAVQTVKANFMSQHWKLYPMLCKHREWVKRIEATERQLTGREYPYIPKANLADSQLQRQGVLGSNTEQLRRAVQDGDIIAIVTSKEGLEIAHVGIAVWHDDGLHLLHASSTRKKVVEEPVTLYRQMQSVSDWKGVRIARLQ